jgi:hypothetical protein
MLSMPLSACGESLPEELPVQATVGQVVVKSNTSVDPNELAYLFAVAHYWMGYDGLSQPLTIDLTDDLPVANDGTTVWGLTRPGRALIRAKRGDTSCLGATPLAHELGHWFQFLKTGDSDPEHKSDMFEGEYPRADIVWIYARSYCKQDAETQGWLLQQTIDLN